jgi:hypothetical protein
MGCLNEAMRLNQGTNDFVNQAYIYVRFTHLSKARSEYVKALDYAEQAEASVKMVNSPFDHFSLYSELAEVLSLGQTTDHLKQKALDLLEKAEGFEESLSVGSLILRNRLLKAELLSCLEPVEASMILDRVVEELKGKQGKPFFSDEVMNELNGRIKRLSETIKHETERIRELEVNHLNRVIEQTKDEEELCNLKNLLEIIKDRTGASRVIMGLPHSEKIRESGRIVLLGVDPSRARESSATLNPKKKSSGSLLSS